VYRTDKQVYAQSLLPLTLVPIRIDLNITPFQPTRALPPPPSDGPQNIATLMPQFKPGEMTTPYKLKDFFLWNLHESLVTPRQFATILINELDLPAPQSLVYIEEITNQIRTQLEEYAGVALHPLFHATNTTASNDASQTAVPTPRDISQTPAASSTPGPYGMEGLKASSSRITVGQDEDSVSAAAAPISSGSIDINNLDDTYRCIITLNINLLNKLYTDKFEWSLLHPPGTAEMFAKQTCADLGLAGEWVPAMAHAIYEAVLRLKKEACESGGLVGGGEIDNSAANGQEAGWRYDPEHLADEWEPKVEILSKEEIEKREGDRERQIRRLRRETARFSSTTNMAGGAPTGYFDPPDAETPLGRGERIKRKRRLRSLSPTGRGGTPGGTSESAGYGGGAGILSDR
jgi:chromatin structure-remodeling complex subunit SFH1